MKKLSLKGLHKRAWDIQSKYIRKEANGFCYTCNIWHSIETCDAGHGEHGNSLDFDFHNGIWTKPRWIQCQCKGCNRYRHGNLTPFHARLVKEYGPEILDTMLEQKHKIKKWKREELEQIIKEYKDLEL